jgi:ABC-2 type transport system permease protein
MATTTNKRKQQQRQAAIRLATMAGILICLNVLAARFHTGLDMTREKRFTLSNATRKMLGSMKDVAVVDIYLTGKFPAGFQRLAEATRERLQSFRDIAGQHVVFRYVNPVEGLSGKAKQQAYNKLADKGIYPVDLKIKGGDEGYSEKEILPYALVQYNGKEKAVKLLESHSGMNQGEIFSYSETMLEYNFANAIRELHVPDMPRVAYITGNNEALGWDTYDGLTTIPQIYHLDTVDLTHVLYLYSSYDAIIINRPTAPFTEAEKVRLDQYVMRGGHILWLINELYTPMDSLRTSPQFISQEYGLNLDDLFFKYGVRVNTDLIEDYDAVPIPMITGRNNQGQPDIEPRKWIYFPIILPSSDHPIVKNMPALLTKFPNSIDTIADREISKTILLQSSKYSRKAQSPVRISLGMVKYPMPPENFKKPFQPIAVLAEGKFHSLFQNHLPVAALHALDSIRQPYKAVTDSATSMIFATGSIMENGFYQDRGPMEMGYWDYTKDNFSNKNFILNCLEYLTDRSGLIEARSKDLTVRLLDVKRVNEEKTQWQIINISVPIGIVLIFASCYLFFRRRRYEKKQ